MPFINVDGTKTFYESKGTSDPVLFVHGSSCNHSIWRNQIDFFGKKFQAIGIDLMGHGKSKISISPQEITVKRYADFVNNFIEALGAEDIAMVGHSLGGAVCIQFCLDFPEKIRCVGLINTGARLAVNPQLLAMLRKDFRKTLTMGLESVLGQTREETALIMREVERQMLKTSPAVGLADFEACNKFDFRERLSQIHKPTIIIGGSHDVLTPTWFHDYLHEKIRNSTLRIINGVGHFSMIEKPCEFNAILAEFLKNI